MIGFSPTRMGLPARWSLAPEDVLGLVFWTRDPRALIQDVDLLKPYSLVIHMTITDWWEVEDRVPRSSESLEWLKQAVDTFGTQNVVWRFSPVPAVDDVVERFERLVKAVYPTGLRSVYMSFLQENDQLWDPRNADEQRQVIRSMAQVCPSDFEVRLCRENRVPIGGSCKLLNLRRAVCEDGSRFHLPVHGPDSSLVDSCGCAISVDAFTINEGCKFGCKYCYAVQEPLDPIEKS
jgi:hypothetical protein